MIMSLPNLFGFPCVGNNVDLHNNIMTVTEMMVSQAAVPASSRGCSPTGDHM